MYPAESEPPSSAAEEERGERTKGKGGGGGRRTDRGEGERKDLDTQSKAQFGADLCERERRGEARGDDSPIYRVCTYAGHTYCRMLFHGPEPFVCS